MHFICSLELYKHLYTAEEQVQTSAWKQGIYCSFIYTVPHYMDTYSFTVHWCESRVCPGHHLGACFSLMGRVLTRRLSPEFWLRPCRSIWKGFLTLSPLEVNTQICSLWKDRDREDIQTQHWGLIIWWKKEMSALGPLTLEYSKMANAAAWLQKITLNRTCFYLATLKDEHFLLCTQCWT